MTITRRGLFKILAGGVAVAVVGAAIPKSRDPLRMYRYWRTASTELVALAPKAPYIGPESAFEGKDARPTALFNSRPWPWFVVSMSSS